MSLEDSGGYVVLSAIPIGYAQCRCGTCKWRGFTTDLSPVKACELKPGDLSPAGRCPKCMDLAYPDRPEDREVSFANMTHDVLSRLVDLQERMAAGKSVKASAMADLLGEAKAVLRAVRGRKLPARKA